MEIRVLRYFLAVVREEGINKAAEVLHITQPTLSRQIAQLEEEVGVKLFERGSRKITLTNEGMLLRRRAEEILSLVDKTEAELMEQDELVEGRIAFGCGEMTAVQILPEIIASFREKYPRVTYDILTETADVVKEQMEKGLIDIAILIEPVDIEKYDFIRLNQKERYVAVMRPDDELAKKKFITAEDLSDKPLILPRRTSIKNELMNWFGHEIKDSQIVFTINLSTNATIMVNGGLGYLVAVEGSMPYRDKEHVVFRPLLPELTATCVFAWKRQQPFSLAASKFIEHLKCFPGISRT